MKAQKAFLTLVLGVFITSMAIAQTSDDKSITRKEKKEWKKKKRKMSWEAFKLLNEDFTEQNSQINTLEEELSAAQSQVSAKNMEIYDLKSQLTKTQSAYQADQDEIAKLKAELNQVPDYNPYMINGEDFSKGVAFRVQVGAFENMDITEYANTSKEFMEENSEELKRYVVGNFRNYEDANILKKYLRQMGVNDAWIVPYRDNKRVPLKKLIETPGNSN